MLKTVAKLFDIHQNTVTSWKKENKKGLTLILKYFSKADLLEFLEFGSIEKLEFSNLQDYQKRASEFVLLLSSLATIDEQTVLEPEMAIDYFAFATCEGMDRFFDDTSKSAYAEMIIRAYDEYKKNKDFSSWRLGELLYNFNSEYPIYEGYDKIISYFIQNDFLPFVKVCSMYQLQHIDLAIKFCITFNLYKYNSPLNFKDIYIKITNDNLEYCSIAGSLKFKFYYDKFKTEIQNIQKSKK